MIQRRTPPNNKVWGTDVSIPCEAIGGTLVQLLQVDPGKARMPWTGLLMDLRTGLIGGCKGGLFSRPGVPAV